MNISFSTLGCPNWMWSEILSAAKDLGYKGIELRGLGDDLFVPDIRIFSDANIEATKRELLDLDIKIPCLSTGFKLYKDEAGFEHVNREIEIAKKLGAPYIRVLGDKWGPVSKPVDDGFVYDRVMKLLPYAEKNGVVLLIETNGAFADTKRLRKLIERIGSDHCKVLWDINHPARNFRESAETTFDNIGEFLAHMHIKDSIVEDGQLKYKMVGYGDLPLERTLRLLKNSKYDGFLSLEWTKRWNPELEDAGIVFAHFPYMMNKIWNQV